MCRNVLQESVLMLMLINSPTADLVYPKDWCLGSAFIWWSFMSSISEIRSFSYDVRYILGNNDYEKVPGVIQWLKGTVMILR